MITATRWIAARISGEFVVAHVSGVIVSQFVEEAVVDSPGRGPPCAV
jgi:hypothetical protein